jgi:hypothetical protein
MSDEATQQEELEDRAVAAGLDPAEYDNDDDLRDAVAEAEGDEDGEQGEGVEGVQPMTDDDIPDSGR